MAKLVLLLDGNVLNEFELDQERINIGRRPSNQIHVDNLAVSGVHAVIVTIGNDSFLEDLNSTNGTVVNGKTIKKHVLLHDDVIELGNYKLKYINEKQVSAADDFEKTMIIRPAKRAPATIENRAVETNTTDAKVAAALMAKVAAQLSSPIPAPVSMQAAVQQAPSKIVAAKVEDALSHIQPVDAPENMVSPTKEKAPTSEPVARLKVLNGASVGRELLLNKTITTLGKPGSQVAVITKRPHGYFITHVGGNSLPKVNGQVTGLQAFELHHLDIIELANISMQFVFS